MQVTEAALRLQEAAHEDSAHLNNLTAVQEQAKLFAHIKSVFSQRLETHLTDVFQGHVRGTGDVGRCFRDM